MSTNEESQTITTLSDIINPNSNINPEPNPERMSLKESKEVNDKISELISEKHSNDINEAKDDNDTKIKYINLKDRLKKKGKDNQQSED